MDTYLVGLLMFIAFYTGVYSNKKMSGKIKIITLGVSILWPLAIVYVVLERPISRLMKGVK